MRPVPQNLDAERSLLGGLVLDPEALADVAGLVEPRHFYRPTHGMVYSAMLGLEEKRETIDRVSLKGELTKRGLFEAVGGDDFVDVLDKIAPSAANLRHYAQLVLDASLLRDVISLGHEITEKAGAQETSGAQLVDEASARLLEMRLGANHSSREPVSLRDAAREALKLVEARYSSGEEVHGLRTGLSSVDTMTLGWRPGELVVLAARPGVGKSAMAGCWAAHAGIAEKKTVAWFSLEMDRTELMMRLLSARSRVHLDRLESGRCIESDWSKLAKASGEFAESWVHLDDTPGVSALEVRAKTRRIAARAPPDRPLGLVVVDYLQIMRRREGVETTNDAIAEITAQMKLLAREMKCVVLLLSQLNREVEKRAGGRPQLSDLRSSGSVEQDADSVMFIVREQGSNEAMLYLDKRRGGRCGDARVEYRGEYTLFLDHGERGHDWVDRTEPTHASSGG